MCSLRSCPTAATSAFERRKLTCMPQPRHVAWWRRTRVRLGVGLDCPRRRSTTSSDSPSTSADRPTRGILRGQVLRPPGRDPRSGSGPPGRERRSGSGGSCVPVTGDPLQIHDMRGQVIASVVTKSGGLFSIALPPGEYQIVEGICGVSKDVNVRSGLSTRVILSIPNAC